MASLTRWTWVWVNSGGWWWTGRPGVLRFMGSQRVGHDWATELNWTKVNDRGFFRSVSQVKYFRRNVLKNHKNWQPLFFCWWSWLSHSSSLQSHWRWILYDPAHCPIPQQAICSLPMSLWAALAEYPSCTTKCFSRMNSLTLLDVSDDLADWYVCSLNCSAALAKFSFFSATSQ